MKLFLNFFFWGGVPRNSGSGLIYNKWHVTFSQKIRRKELYLIEFDVVFDYHLFYLQERATEFVGALQEITNLYLTASKICSEAFLELL